MLAAKTCRSQLPFLAALSLVLVVAAGCGDSTTEPDTANNDPENQDVESEEADDQQPEAEEQDTPEPERPEPESTPEPERPEPETTDPSEPETATPLTDTCDSLEKAILGGDELFTTVNLIDIDSELSQKVEDLLSRAADGLPPTAPPTASTMLTAASEMLGALGDAATADEPAAQFRAEATQAQMVFETLDWEPIETYFDEECDIEVLGIELKLRDDDRTTTTTTTAPAVDDASTSEG